MSLISQIDSLQERDKSEAVRKLIKESTPDSDFFLLVVLSILMATFGMLINSASVVIGSMLIAPILFPILSISLGLVMSDGKLFWRSILTVLRASVIGVAASVLVTLFFKSTIVDGLSPEILARAEPSLAYFFIAVISGFAVTYTLVKPDLSETLPGIAVAVALIPPLSVVGIGIAVLDATLIYGSLSLYLINIVGMSLASIVGFSLMRLHSKRKVADTAIKKEEKRLEKEIEIAKKTKEEIAKNKGK